MRFVCLNSQMEMVHDSQTQLPLTNMVKDKVMQEKPPKPIEPEVKYLGTNEDNMPVPEEEAVDQPVVILDAT